MNLNINAFENDVYIGIDKELLRNKLHSITAARISRELKLNRDTVERWYRDKIRAIPVYALKYICNLTNTNPSKFEIKWIGGKGYLRNRLVPFLGSDLAYLMGLIVGDGHLYENRIVISGEEPFIKEIVVPHCQKLFPKMKIIARDMKDCFWAELNSRPLVWFVRDIFDIPIGKKTTTVRIPRVILASDKKIIYSFISGLFDSDGSVSKRKRNNTLDFFTSSKRLKDDVVRVFEELGISTSLYIDKRSTHPVYRVSAYSKEKFRIFFENINFKHPRKKAILKILCSS